MCLFSINHRVCFSGCVCLCVRVKIKIKTRVRCFSGLECYIICYSVIYCDITDDFGIQSLSIYLFIYLMEQLYFPRNENADSSKKKILAHF